MRIELCSSCSSWAERCQPQSCRRCRSHAGNGKRRAEGADGAATRRRTRPWYCSLRWPPPAPLGDKVVEAVRAAALVKRHPHVALTFMTAVVQRRPRVDKHSHLSSCRRQTQWRASRHAGAAVGGGAQGEKEVAELEDDKN